MVTVIAKMADIVIAKMTVTVIAKMADIIISKMTAKDKTRFTSNSAELDSHCIVCTII